MSGHIERQRITNWQNVQDYELVVRTLREAMVESDEKSTRVLARDTLRAMGESA